MRQARLAVLLILVALAAGAGTPAKAVPGVREALARLQAGDAAGAATILDGVVAREPKNALAWRYLGFVSIKSKNLDRALECYKRALEIEPGMPQALYNIGIIHALRGEKDQAFEWLGKAKATRRLDMTSIQTEANLASLNSDPRFDALLPEPASFADPFVEPVRIIREWDGEAAGDQFGWIARNIGDVDGDGVPDVVTSAPTNGAGGKDAGRIYVYSTKTGALLWTADGGPGDGLGTGVEAAGDTNHDGIPDVIAGAPDGGKAFVYSGRDGRVLRAFSAGGKGDNFGRHVCGVGDVDHDGHDDVLVGAPGDGAAGGSPGNAYLYSGRDGHLIRKFTGERAGDAFGSTVGGRADRNGLFLIVGAPGAGPRGSGRTYVYTSVSGKPKFVIESDETGHALGEMFVSVLGDVDGDGTPDIYASDWSNAAKGPSTGRIYVHSGKTGRRLLTLTGETAGEGFGIGPATAGDVDGDGRADLIVGSWQYGGAAISGGRASLYSGRDGRLLKTYTCRVPGDTFGFDAVGMGDVDGDGTIDFLITSGWSAIHGNHSGRMFIVSSGVTKKPG